jgi:microcystin-dependent protein
MGDYLMTYTPSEPSGTIKMWHGIEADVPVGWQICDGTNGTPDLRDKFVVGAGSSYTLGETGGSAELQEHSHTINGDSYGDGAYSPYTYPLMASQNNVTKSTAINSAGTGDSGNIPPYYALFYIMKI